MWSSVKDAAKEGKTRVNRAANAAVDRLNTADAARKLVDEGGPRMTAKLIAKKASTDAVNHDSKFFQDLQQVFGAYCVASQRMKGASEHTVGESPPFATLANQYANRAAGLKAVIDQLQRFPERASVSSVEKDAIAIVVAKMKASGLKKSLTGKLGGAAPSNAPAPEPESEPSDTPAGSSGDAPASSSSAGMGSWLQKYEHAKERAHMVGPAKSMVDKGGEPVIAKLLAKKASMDATSFDQELMPRLEKVIESYADAAAKMRESANSLIDESTAFHDLATQYEARSAELGRVSQYVLPRLPACVSLSPMEKNAILYIVAQTTVGQTKVAQTVQELQIGHTVQDVQAPVSVGRATSDSERFKFTAHIMSV